MTARADRPLPGRARRPRRRRRRAPGGEPKQGAILAAITALKQICNHPAAYQDDDRPLAGRSGKLARLEEIVESVFAAGERILVFTHFAEWGKKLADHLTEVTGVPIACYHGGLARGARDRLVARVPERRRARAPWCCRSRPAAPASTSPPPATSCSTTAGGTRRSRTRPATGRGASARPARSCRTAWCAPAPSTSGSRRSWPASATSPTSCCPKSSSLADLDADQLRVALGLRPDTLLTEDDDVSHRATHATSRGATRTAAGAAAAARPAAGRPLAARARSCPSPSRSCPPPTPPRCCARSATRRCRARARSAEHYLAAVVERAARRHRAGHHGRARGHVRRGAGPIGPVVAGVVLGRPSPETIDRLLERARTRDVTYDHVGLDLVRLGPGAEAAPRRAPRRRDRRRALRPGGRRVALVGGAAPHRRDRAPARRVGGRGPDRS